MSQPDLFTRRVRKPKSADETALHCAIADTIRIAIKPGWLWFHYPAGGWRTKAEAGKFKRMGVKEGISDFILFGPPAATVHALELKVPGNKPTEAQMAFLELVRAAGGFAVWVDSYGAAIDVLTHWGALKNRITVT